MRNGITCIKDSLDSRLFRTNELPIIGKDQRLIFLITFFLHIFKVPGARSQFFHRSRTATAGYLRNHAHGIFITNSQKKVGNVIGESCFRCRRTGGTLQSTQPSHHRVTLEAPFTRLSIDILGPHIVKASQNSRSLIKVWAILGVCLSTGLLTHQMVDQISHESIVRALWCVQMKHGVCITHLHTENGTQFRHLGGLGMVSGSTGEQLRLFILLNTINISASRGQRSNTVESFISRLKTLWK